MGIYDRDWYRRKRENRFGLPESQKDGRLKNIRDAFHRFTKTLSVPVRTSYSRYSGQAPHNSEQKIPFRRSTVIHSLFWLGIGALFFALFTWLNTPKITQINNRVEVIVPTAADGHHYVDGMINGHSVKFLIDTGATYVSVGSSIASQLDLGPGQDTNFQTANGKVVGKLIANQAVAVAGLQVPPLTVGIMPNAQHTALLGQNFLRHIEMTQADRKLILKGQYLPNQIGNVISTTQWVAFAGASLLLFSLFLYYREKPRRAANESKPGTTPANQRRRAFTPAVIDERLLLACSGDQGLARRLIETEMRRAPLIDEFEATNRALKRFWDQD